jgi:hypothetical protein
MIQHEAIGIMYTRTCPLACAHCVTESSPRAGGRMSVEQARRYLPAIRRFSRRVSFTGGEPLLYHRDIVELAAEARRLGLEVSVVTGAGWVTGAAKARRRVRELAAAGVGRLAISWDAYHGAFAPRERALILAREACEAGIAVEVRTVLPAGRDLEEFHAPFRHLPVRLESTAPLKLGTARALPDDAFRWTTEPPKGFCTVVLRPVIEPDGAVYACCGPAHFSPRPSPLVLGNAEETPLDEILARAVRDPLLEAISLIGPGGLYRLLAGPADRGAAPRPRDRYSGVCDLCLDLNGSAETVAALRRRLEASDAQILLAAARMWADRRRPPRAADRAPGPLEAGEVHEHAGHAR